MKSVLLILSTIFLTTNIFASNDNGYQAKLNQILEVVPVKFSVGLPFISKARGVNNLHQYLFSTPNRQHFGKDALVKKVIINNNLFGEEQFFSLHGSTLYYLFDGTLDEELTDSFPRFYNEINRMDELTSELKELVPAIQIVRGNYLDLLEMTPNDDFVTHLERFHNILQTNNHIVEKMNSLDRVILEDIVVSFPHTCGSFTTYYSGLEQTPRKSFIVRLETFYDGIGLASLSSVEFIQAVMEILLIKEFKTIRYVEADHRPLNNAVISLKQVLTNETTDLLKTNGVKSFFINSYWQSMDQWLDNQGTLTVAMNQEDIEFIIDTLFR